MARHSWPVSGLKTVSATQTASIVTIMRRFLLPLLLLPALLLTSCSQKEVQDAVSKGTAALKERAAVTATESLRIMLVEEAKKRGIAPDNAELVTEITGRIPGAEFTPAAGGRLSVAYLGGFACVVLPTAANQGSVVAGVCV